MAKRPRYCVGTLLIAAAICVDAYYLLVERVSSLSLPCLCAFFALILGTVLVHTDPGSRHWMRRLLVAQKK